MKSKISYFNRTIFLKNITRFWPIWALYLVILLFGMPIKLFLNTQLNISSVENVAGRKLDYMLNCVDSNLMPMTVFLFSILCAVAVFSYLYSTRNCYMIHALPVKRGELFLTGYLNGLLFMIVPQVITFLLTLFVCVVNNVTSVEYLFFWLLYTVGMTFVFYSGAVFCCMLAANYFAGVVFYVLGNTIYIILKFLIVSIVSVLCYGMSSLADSTELWKTKDVFLSPIVYLTQQVGIGWDKTENYSSVTDINIYGSSTIAFYLIPAAVMIVLSILLYRKRELECAGDVLAVKWLKPIFRWGIAFSAGIGLALLFALMFFYDKPQCTVVLMICSVIFSCICFFLSDMILRKKFRVFQKKRWVEWGICAGAIFVVLCAIEGDWFRIERRMPDAKDVEIVMLRSDYDILLTDEEEIEKLMDMHQTILDHKKEYENYYYNVYQKGGSNSFLTDTVIENGRQKIVSIERIPAYTNVTVIYYLENGKKETRSYYVPTESKYSDDPSSAAGKIIALQKNPQTYLDYFFGKNPEDIQFAGGNYNFVNREGVEDTRDLTGQEVKELFEAIKKDILAGNYTYGFKCYTKDAAKDCYDTIGLEGEIRSEKSIYDVLPREERAKYKGESPSVVYPTGDAEETSAFFSTFAVQENCSYTIDAMVRLGMITDRSDLTLMERYNGLVTEYATD